MTKEEAEAKINAAAWTVAAEIGWREAIEILQRAASQIQAAQWSGAGGR